MFAATSVPSPRFKCVGPKPSGCDHPGVHVRIAVAIEIADVARALEERGAVDRRPAGGAPAEVDAAPRREIGSAVVVDVHGAREK